MRIFQPEVFQGNWQKRNYFEGWYIKCVDAKQQKSYAFIFGVSLQQHDQHAFIQMIDGQTGKTNYQRFAFTDVAISQRKFAVTIGANHVNQERLELDVIFPDGQTVFGTIQFGAFQVFPVSLLRPGIMGWYRYVPKMECYHGVVSQKHSLQGSLTFDGITQTFTGGRGYIEKDWGTSMPKAWIWTQSNHASINNQANYMLSVADIPWLKQSFTGFLGYIDTGEKCYYFATYTGARLEKITYGSGGLVEVVIQDKQYWYHFLLWDGLTSGILQAPVLGEMSRQIHEAIHASAAVTIYSRRSQKSIFESEFSQCGLERVGQLSPLAD
ncbi:MAG: tocopherol cyclase family protein [Culicoidibacterales bacterium]